MLRGKFTAVNTNLKKIFFQINNLTFHLKKLEEKKEINPKTSRRKK